MLIAIFIGGHDVTQAPLAAFAAVLPPPARRLSACARSAAGLAEPVIRPPSTASIWPVIIYARSLAKLTASPISSIVHMAERDQALGDHVAEFGRRVLLHEQREHAARADRVHGDAVSWRLPTRGAA